MNGEVIGQLYAQPKPGELATMNDVLFTKESLVPAVVAFLQERNYVSVAANGTVKEIPVIAQSFEFADRDTEERMMREQGVHLTSQAIVMEKYSTPFTATETHKTIKIGHEGTDTLTFTFVEKDNDSATVRIVNGVPQEILGG